MRPISSVVSVLFVGAAIALVHCSSSTSTSGVAKFGPPVRHYPAGTSCRTTRPPGSPNDNLPDAAPVVPSCAAGTGADCKCRSDADCTGGTNGRCLYLGNGPGSVCTYDACSSSNDCTAGSACACGDLVVAPNVCVPSNCRVDTDCGANGYCSPTRQAQCDRTNSFAGAYCHTPQDDCVNDSDCGSANTPSPFGGGPACNFSSEANKWVCDNILCAAG